MNATMLLVLAILWHAEADGYRYPPDGDGGLAKGPYQIHACVVQDVNAVYGTSFTHEQMRNLGLARYVCLRYLQHWGGHYKITTGKEPTLEVYCRIWNGGPNGWKRKATVKYWERRCAPALLSLRGTSK